MMLLCIKPTNMLKCTLQLYSTHHNYQGHLDAHVQADWNLPSQLRRKSYDALLCSQCCNLTVQSFLCSFSPVCICVYMKTMGLSGLSSKAAENSSQYVTPR